MRQSASRPATSPASTSSRQPRWTADDALRVASRLTEWLETPGSDHVTKHLVWGTDTFSDKRAEHLASTSNELLTHMLRERDVIWCDPNMVDLLAAAAAAVPATWNEPLAPHDLIDPEAGIVVFAKPLPAEWSFEDPSPLLHYETELSAVTWESPLDLPNGLIVRGWTRAETRTLAVAGRRVQVRDLAPSPAIEAPAYGQIPAGQPMVRMLRALTALCRDRENTTQEHTIASKRARATARRAGHTTDTVHRIYLRSPDTGLRELEALRAERGGVRGHWVRGHWRHQWYASVEEHRWVWVSGFPRGDFTREEHAPRAQIATTKKRRANP